MYMSFLLVWSLVIVCTVVCVVYLYGLLHTVSAYTVHSLREERMREALGDISTQGSPHWWACAYGPHPQQLIIAEQAGVGLIDLRVS